MPRYINEDDFCEYIRKNTTPSGAEWFISKIKDMPAANVAEIVRCKDCIYRDKFKGVYNHGTPTNFIWCNFYSSNRWENGYCNEGVRRKTDA